MKPEKSEESREDDMSFIFETIFGEYLVVFICTLLIYKHFNLSKTLLFQIYFRFFFQYNTLP